MPERTRRRLSLIVDMRPSFILGQFHSEVFATEPLPVASPAGGALMSDILVVASWMEVFRVSESLLICHDYGFSFLAREGK